MKKLVTAACALVAGIAMAQVQSANTVGFQDFTGTGSFNLTVATFLPVGTDGSTMTLGDIVGNDAFIPGTDRVILFDGGDFLKTITYSNPSDAAYWGITSGWYEISDYEGDGLYNLNSTSIPYGVGVAFARTTAGAGLKYVGEVKQADNTLPAANSFNMCGNTAPKAITLGDVTGNAAFVPGTDRVILFDGGDFLKTITYSNPSDAASWGITPGWYEISDYEDEGLYNLNSTSIPAGAGFAFAKTTAAARLIVANPISSAE